MAFALPTSVSLIGRLRCALTSTLLRSCDAKDQNQCVDRVWTTNRARRVDLPSQLRANLSISIGARWSGTLQDGLRGDGVGHDRMPPGRKNCELACKHSRAEAWANPYAVIAVKRCSYAVVALVSQHDLSLPTCATPIATCAQNQHKTAKTSVSVTNPSSNRRGVMPTNQLLRRD